MSEENQQQPKEEPTQQLDAQPAAQPAAVDAAKSGWTSTQVYTMAVLCLVVGIAVGYLFRSSNGAAPATQPTAVQQQPEMPAQGMPGGMPGGMPQQPPTPEQMKSMADKKVAPLLDQLKQNPKDVDTLLKIGGFYMAAQQFDDARNYYQKAVDVKATTENLTHLANAEAMGGKGDEAMATLNKALQIDPKSANALYNLGMLKWQVKGDLNGAIACWETLVKTNPNHPQIEQVKQLIAQAKQHAKMTKGAKPAAPAN
jgi:cytochrome c-type biogenesis protein CcmH/NrfG